MKVREVERPWRSRMVFSGRSVTTWCVASVVALVGCGGGKTPVQVDAVVRADSQVVGEALGLPATPAPAKVADVAAAVPSEAPAPTPGAPVPNPADSGKPSVAEAPSLVPGSRRYQSGKEASVPEVPADAGASVEPAHPTPSIPGATAARVAPSPEDPKKVVKAMSPGQAKLVARGQYVANLAGCATCHVERVPYGVVPRPYAGGFLAGERLGYWRAPNITQDKKTGIGGWTDAEIITAVREGKRPDGSQLFPVMPYPYFNAMTDDDAKALVAFLRTIEPAENAVEGNTTLRVAKVEMPPIERTEPKTKSDRGRYLAALMHCGICHRKEGPVLEWYGIVDKVDATAAYPAHIDARAPSYKPAWLRSEIKDAVSEGRDPKAPQTGPMGIYGPSWKHVSDDDLDALAEFLAPGPEPAHTP